MGLLEDQINKLVNEGWEVIIGSRPAYNSQDIQTSYITISNQVTTPSNKRYEVIHTSSNTIQSALEKIYQSKLYKNDNTDN